MKKKKPASSIHKVKFTEAQIKLKVEYKLGLVKLNSFISRFNEKFFNKAPSIYFKPYKTDEQVCKSFHGLYVLFWVLFFLVSSKFRGRIYVWVTHRFFHVFLMVATVLIVRLHCRWRSDCCEGDVQHLSHPCHEPEI